MSWLNKFGLLIMVLMLPPNILYAFKTKTAENKCKNKAMNVSEQIGRYGSMLFMIFNIGIYEFGFRSNETFGLWKISMIVLILLYWFYWFLYFRSQQLFTAMMLAIIPSIIFISSGYLYRHWLLLIFGILFSIGHIFVTYQNNMTT